MSSELTEHSHSLSPGHWSLSPCLLGYSARWLAILPSPVLTVWVNHMLTNSKALHSLLLLKGCAFIRWYPVHFYSIVASMCLTSGLAYLKPLYEDFLEDCNQGWLLGHSLIWRLNWKRFTFKPLRLLQTKFQFLKSSWPEGFMPGCLRATISSFLSECLQHGFLRLQSQNQNKPKVWSCSLIREAMPIIFTQFSWLKSKPQSGNTCRGLMRAMLGGRNYSAPFGTLSTMYVPQFICVQYVQKSFKARDSLYHTSF